MNETLCSPTLKEFYLGDNPFSSYMKNKREEKGFHWTEVFDEAGVSRSYGFKLVDGFKRTRQRDTILKICIAGGFSVRDTSRALQFSDMSNLRPLHPRDAVIIRAIQSGIRNIDEINELLELKGQIPLTLC